MPPIIVGSNPERVNVVVNNFVSLSCEATGFPPPTLSWLTDRGPVQANANALIMPGMVSLGYSVWTPFSNDLSGPECVFLVLRRSYASDYESKSFGWGKVQLCGHECSRRGSQTRLPHSIQ